MCPPAFVLLMTFLGLGLSAGILFAVVPTIIAQAYQGESLAILNAMIQGQALHPVGHYLQVWRDVSVKILTVGAMLGLLLALLSWVPLQRAVDRVLGAPVADQRNGARFGMTRWQLTVANCVVFALVGVQVADIALQREDWPFSNYPMYAGEQTAELRWMRLYGVAQAEEVRLVPDQYLRPFDDLRMHNWLGVLARGGHDTETRRALQDLYRLYEAGRRAGEHHGPPVQALRLYRERWRIEPGLANKAAPEERELIYELRVAD
jgi:hypothetical protein